MKRACSGCPRMDGLWLGLRTVDNNGGSDRSEEGNGDDVPGEHGGWLLVECNGGVVNSGMGNSMFCKNYLGN